LKRFAAKRASILEELLGADRRERERERVPDREMSERERVPQTQKLEKVK